MVTACKERSTDCRIAEVEEIHNIYLLQWHLSIQNSCHNLHTTRKGECLTLDPQRMAPAKLVSRLRETARFCNSIYLIRLHSLPQKVECHHGRPDDELWCVCDRGWMSSHLDRASAQPPPAVYHMCNIKVVRPADELAQNRAASNWLFVPFMAYAICAAMLLPGT